MKVGYQGIVGSNSEEAAQIFVERLNLKDVEYIPLVNSQNVIAELENKNINFGVMATSNKYAGKVEETVKALKGCKKEFKCLDTIELPIHHCIFKKNKNIKNDSLKIIASHIQALLQTKQFRKDKLPLLQEKEVEDTALAAKYLAEGKLDDTVAIISRKNAGIMFGLELIYENVEDIKDNLTEFKIYSE